MRKRHVSITSSGRTAKFARDDFARKLGARATGVYNRLRTQHFSNFGLTVSVRSFVGGALIGLTVELPFVAGTDITDPSLRIGLLLWGALALTVVALHVVRPKGNWGRGQRP
jgi:hypothetical protein